MKFFPIASMTCAALIALLPGTHVRLLAEGGERMQDFAPAISAVTVYPDRAMVVRETQVRLEPGRSTLRFRGGSLNLQPQSLRAFADSPKLVVQGVRSFIERTTATDHTGIRELEAALEKLENERDAESRRVERARLDLQGTERYATFLAGFISEHSTVPTTNSGTSYQAALDFLSARRIKARGQVQSGEERIQELRDESAVLRARLQKIQSADRRNSRTVEISIENLGTKSARVGFSYVISGAAWNVSYGMYLEADGSVATEYYGNVRQTTGEDWSNVKLLLSTATPARGAKRSRLAALAVDAYETATREGFFSREEKSDATGAAPGGPTSGEERPEEEDGDFARVQATGGESLVFEIPTRVTAPSSERRQRVTIARFVSRPVASFYQVAPGVQPAAHLALRIKNERRYPLLAGEVDAYRNAGFSGRSEIEYTPAGSEFLAGFGVERSVRVERTLKRYRESAGTLSSGHIFHTRATLRLRNESDQARTIRLQERIPVSSVAEIRVKLESDTTGGYQLSDDGILTWEFELRPRKSRSVELHFTVRTPESYRGEIFGR